MSWPPTASVSMNAVPYAVVPHSSMSSELPIDVLRSYAPWIVRRPRRAEGRLVPDQGADPLGVCGGEQGVGCPTFALPAEDRPPCVHRLQHRHEVRDPCLEIRDREVPAREPGCPAVVQDQPGERGERGVLGREEAGLRHRVDVAEQVELPRQVDRALAHRPVRDVRAVSGARVAELGGDRHPLTTR